MSEEKSKADTIAEMDNYAIDAQNDLVNVDQESLEKVAAWWEKWYLKCGHKRLGRILVKGL